LRVRPGGKYCGIDLLRGSLNGKRVVAQITKCGERRESWSGFTHQSFKTDLKGTLFEHGNMAAALLDIFSPKSQAGIEPIAAQTVNKSAAFGTHPVQRREASIKTL